MSWEQRELITDELPSSSDYFYFDNARLKAYEHSEKGISGSFEDALDTLNKKSTRDAAFFKAFLDKNSFKPTKKLINEYKSLIKMHIKIQQFKLDKVTAALTKDTKTCTNCKVNYPLNMDCSFKYRSERLKKELERELIRLKIEENRPSEFLMREGILSTYKNLNTSVCKCCHKKHILLTNPSIKKVELMEDEILKKVENFVENRRNEQKKQATKKGAKIKYLIMAIIHESSVDNSL